MKYIIKIGEKELTLIGLPNDELVSQFPIDQWIGLYPGLTEEQVASVVEKDKDIIGYVDYLNSFNYFNTALESFASLMEREKLYIENPFGIEEPFVPFYKPDGMSKEEYYYEINRHEMIRSKWQKSEYRTSKNWMIISTRENSLTS